ncbi:MAG: TonB-dependent receptor [gamma proteobacterium symbiont of Taylorina sp.]|nr:TonB-dependent receptor [gamma proteobacterium symbiont of Taylorina sp.]
MLKLVFICFLAILSCHNLIASEIKPSDDITDTEEKAFLSLLEEQTEIATKTKMNVDFVPGMVTILHGEELERKGLHSVLDALETVPGIEIYIRSSGTRSIKVRGVGGEIAFGDIKMMLDNINMNSSISPYSQLIFDLPVEQIERIEVIRGPGSALHGEYAYTAVINVISKKQQKNFYSTIGENNSHLLGGNYFWEDSEKQIKANINVAFSSTDGITTSNDSDALYGTGGAATIFSQANVSRAPGSSMENKDHRSVLFNLTLADYELKFHWLNTIHGTFFGALNVLPDENENFDGDITTIELNKKIAMSRELDIDLKLGWQQQSYDADYSFLPPGYAIWHYPSFPITLENGYVLEDYYKDNKFYGGADFFWQMTDNHSLFLGLDYSQIKVKEAWEKSNMHPNGTASDLDNYPLDSIQKFTFEEGSGLVAENEKRSLFSLTLQDEYQASEALSITAGLRYDHYSDVGDNWSPRLAAVYQINKRHIIKGQYAEAFIKSRFIEEARSVDLRPQTNDTFDISYIYKTRLNRLNVTLYHSKLKNIVDETLSVDIYENKDDIFIKGVELEMEHDFSEQLSAGFNLSYNKTKDSETGEDIPGTTRWLSNIELMYQPQTAYDFSLRYRYVGKKYRESDDPREKLDAYGVVNFNARLNNIFTQGASLQLGVDNLFNEDVRYSARMTTDVFRNRYPGYEDDYPRGGRYWWLRFKYVYD